VAAFYHVLKQEIRSTEHVSVSVQRMLFPTALFKREFAMHF